MSRLQLIETLRMEGGVLQRLSYHEHRYEKAMQHFWPDRYHWRLIDLLAQNGLSEHNNPLDYPGVYKVHMDYNDETGAVLATPYQSKHVESLRIVTDNDIDYSYKYADRSQLSKCLDGRGDCDDVIIVKNGLLTDTSYSNIALYDGTSWFTPRTPLLQGTMRAYLLDNGQIEETDIRPSDLKSFTKVSLINAMLPLGELIVPIDNICFSLHCFDF